MLCINFVHDSRLYENSNLISIICVNYSQFLKLIWLLQNIAVHLC